MHRRGNPNWGRAMPFAPALPTEFELTLKCLRLTPQMYASSRELKRWSESNRNRCYVPEWLPIFFVTTSFVLTFALQRFFPYPFLFFFFGAVVASAWFGGSKPGLFPS